MHGRFRLGRFAGALLLVAIVAGGTYDLTRAWIETGSTVAVGTSMTHGPTPGDGVVDNGDISQLTPVSDRSEVVPFVAAHGRNHRVAGDFGDVVVFYPDGAPTARGLPVQHRVIVWVEFNERTGLFDVPEADLAGVRTLSISNLGWWSAAEGAYVRGTLELPLAVRQPDGSHAYPLGRESGWITKGDASPYFDQSFVAESAGGARPAISGLVKPEWVAGKVVRVWDRGEETSAPLTVALATAGAAIAIVAIHGRRGSEDALTKRAVGSPASA